jgi:hypothetical protein
VDVSVSVSGLLFLYLILRFGVLVGFINWKNLSLWIILCVDRGEVFRDSGQPILYGARGVEEELWTGG